MNGWFVTGMVPFGAPGAPGVVLIQVEIEVS